ncbi:MAG: hypothetical protein DCC71_04400 [Proteobacteria bacterium]|nr:MAG: hypothetical protein DCC71_04400 [Pseudomonadota bacterium]
MQEDATRPGERRPVLVLGPERRARMLSGYLLLLDYRGLGAESAVRALAALANTPTPIRAGLLASDHELPDAPTALREIAELAPAPIVWSVFGPRPDPEQASALRRAGVRFVLADPFTDEELRFVLNEAHHAGSADIPRIDTRVPVSMRVRIGTRNGERVGHVCNLSLVGAYVATPRPTLRGGVVDVHLPIEDGEISLPARVVWNNVPGNLRRANAAIGMGVRFLEVPSDAETALKKLLAERERAYRL